MKELGDTQWIFKRTKNNPFTEQSLREGVINALKKADGSPIDELKQLLTDKKIQDKYTKMFNHPIKDASNLLDAIALDKNFNNIFNIVD